MAIAAVIRGTVEVEGKVFEFDSPKGSAWLESVTSFRFEPSGTNKPYTARKESGAKVAITGTVTERLQGSYTKNILAKVQN
jgi:hypothetical protein